MFRHISLGNFRSYEEYSTKFLDGVNIIAGPNATGKTSLIEALYILSVGKSFKGTDRETLRANQDWLKIEGEITNQKRSLKIRFESERPEKEFKLGEKKLARITHENKLPVVLFEPDHLLMLSGSPGLRREYMDSLLARLWPDYSWAKHQLDRTLTQRNNLLRSNVSLQELKDQIFVWDIKLAEIAKHIARSRLRLVEVINEKIEDIYSEIAGQSNRLYAEYQSNVNVERYGDDLLSKLTSSVELDKKRGFTGYGPQRDDLIFTLNGDMASATASRGETRTIILALKIIELDLLARDFKEPPILLLDDVFSELDDQRQKALAKKTEVYQTFITTTDAGSVARKLNKKYNLIDTTKR